MLGLPDGWRLGIVPASDTGAVEIALWSLLGPRGVDVLAWETFGAGLGERYYRSASHRRHPRAEGALRPASRSPQVDPERDVVLAWNGTTSGVRPPGGDWIAADRQGLVICDATSAVFAMRLPWDRLDVVTWSWQKSLGGEGAHGMLALGARALSGSSATARPGPLPKYSGDWRTTASRSRGSSAARPSTRPRCCAVEDALDGLRWAEWIGGLDALLSRTRENAAAVFAWVESHSLDRFSGGGPGDELAAPPYASTFAGAGCRARSPEDEADRPRRSAGPFERGRCRLRHRRHRDCAAGPAHLDRSDRRAERSRGAPAVAGLGLGEQRRRARRGHGRLKCPTC